MAPGITRSAETELPASAFERALLAIDRVEAHQVAALVARERGPHAFVEELVGPALERIGAAWDRGSIALSQVYMSGRICEDLVDEFLPTAIRGRHPLRCAMAVLDDQHALGKRIVISMLAAAGFDVIDYGKALSAEAIAARALEDKLDVLLISALMLPSAFHVREVVRALRDAGSDMLVIVGGAPFRLEPALWREVGADAMGRTAGDAVALLRRCAGISR